MKKYISLTQQRRIFGSSVAGTTAMSLFSYFLSGPGARNFREPNLLGKLIQRVLPVKTKTSAQMAGWGLHYLVGLLFAETYAPLWTGRPQADMKTGLVLGGISGIAAILIWRFTYAIHPYPPAVHFVLFAAQLFFAHVIFGVFTALGYDVATKSANAIRHTG